MIAPARKIPTPPPVEQLDDLDTFGLLAPDEDVNADRSVESELRLEPLPKKRSSAEPENYWI